MTLALFDPDAANRDIFLFQLAQLGIPSKDFVYAKRTDGKDANVCESACHGKVDISRHDPGQIRTSS